MSNFEDKAREAMANPRNVGEMEDADSVGTAGSADCGDMLRMWLKFTEKDGKKVIDRASFQSFGCQTAIAVASMATELLKAIFFEAHVDQRRVITDAHVQRAAQRTQAKAPTQPRAPGLAGRWKAFLQRARSLQWRPPRSSKRHQRQTLVS